MKKIFALSMMAALVLASCSPKEQLAPVVTPEAGKTIRASIVPETRTYLVEDGDVYHMYWKAGDIIRCTDDGLNAAVLYQTQADGVAAAAFTWMEENGESALCQDSLKFWAYFPHTRGRKLAAIQQYDPNGLTAAPIRGYYERASLEEPFDPNFEFKNVCGALKLNLTTTASDVKVVAIVFKADNGLSGSYSNSVAEPAAVVSSQTSTVTLECPEVALGAEPTPFYVSLPPYSYGAFSITVVASDGRTQTRSLKAGEILTIERAQLDELSLAFDDLQKPAVGETATFMKARDMNTTIKGLVNSDVTSYSDDDTTITKMVFLTESNLLSPVNVADATSESPIYVLYDEATTTVTVATPAKKFVMHTDSWGFFHRFKALKTIEGIDDFDSSNVESMAYFFGYSALDHIKMPATWDYSKVINTRYMFYGSTCQSIDVSEMDFSQDTSMAYMFGDIQTAPEITWPAEVDCSNLTTMASMFRYSNFSQIDLSMFVNTDAVTTIRYMFAYDTMLTKVIANFNLEALNTGTSGIGYTWAYCSEYGGLLDLTEFDISTTPTLSYAFYCCYASTLDLSTWNCESCQFMNYMFFRMKFLANLYLGPDFYPAASTPGATGYLTPTNFTGSTSDTMENGLSTVHGSLNVYTTQEIADWLVYTLLRKQYWGSYTGTELPITFYDIDSPTTVLEVTWQPA